MLGEGKQNDMLKKGAKEIYSKHPYLPAWQELRHACWVWPCVVPWEARAEDGQWEEATYHLQQAEGADPASREREREREKR